MKTISMYISFHLKFHAILKPFVIELYKKDRRDEKEITRAIM